jgi:hypothetical protein
MGRPRIRRSAARALALLAAATGILLAPAMGQQSAEAGTPGYKLSYAKLPDGKVSQIRWNGCQYITYKVNLAAVPSASRTAVLNETHASMRALAYRTGFSFTYRGLTSEVPQTTTVDRQSAELIVAYTTPARTNLPLSGSVLGQGGFRYRVWSTYSKGKTTYSVAATRGYVVIDSPDMLRYLKPGFGVGKYRGNLIQHELAHAFGLQHVSNTAALAYPTIHARTPKGYTYSGDVEGLRRVGRSMGCINMAGSGVTDLR